MTRAINEAWALVAVLTVAALLCVPFAKRSPAGTWETMRPEPPGRGLETVLSGVDPVVRALATPRRQAPFCFGLALGVVPGPMHPCGWAARFALSVPSSRIPCGCGRSASTMMNDIYGASRTGLEKVSRTHDEIRSFLALLIISTTSAPLDAIVERLTHIGLEVEHVDNPVAALKDFVVGHVLAASQHPNADRLRVCIVDIGSRPAPVQVVCGAAQRARAGHEGRLLASRHLYSRQEDHARQRRYSRRRIERHVVFGRGTRTFRRPRGIIELPRRCCRSAKRYVGVVLQLEDPAVIERSTWTPNRPDAAGGARHRA